MSKRKQIIAFLVGVILLAGAAGTFAWLSVTGVLVNQFSFGSVTPSVDETLNGNVKSDVTAKNKGYCSRLSACCSGYLLAGQGWRTPVG